MEAKNSSLSDFTGPRSHTHAVRDALARSVPMSMLGHTVNVSLALAAFWHHVALAPLIIWAIGSYGIAAWVLWRWATRHTRSSSKSTGRPTRSNYRGVLIGAVMAAPWGVLTFWLLGELPQQPELVLIALCVGMSAAGSVLLSAAYPSAIAYMICILVPVALKCFVVLGGGEYRILGALTISYGVFLLACIGSCAKLFADRNRAVDELRQSLLETQAAKRHIEQANMRFESALRNMPQGLSMFDSDDCLVACNRQYLDIYGLSQNDVSIGMKFHEIFAKQNLVPDLGEYLSSFKKRIAALGYSNNTVTFPDGRVVYISYALNADGGWVATHEDITQRKAFERKIEQLAHFDSLTNLANRNLFKDRLEEELARHRRLPSQFAVLLLDLDKFKAVNDAFGHQAGDLLLQKVADRIKATVREVDMPARLGGDEFGLLALGGQSWSKETVAVLAHRLINVLSSPYEIDGHPVVIGCSIGIALVPDHGARSDELLRKADLALYESKSSGRNCFNFYSDALGEKADRRNVLEIELREAIWREEIGVHYQPIFELSSGRIVAVEALARWRHKTLGMIPPSTFIPIAEDAGLIADLGNLVLVRACGDAMRMPEHIRVSVNLSPAQFAKSDVVESVIFGLVDTGLPENRLELEITEGVFLAENQRNNETLERLKKLGVSIALDDFGVGYSSLSYLTAFPFDKVKIDKSFIANVDRLETGAVLASIVQLSKALNLSLVVEGIETVHQLEKARSLNIGLGQGYLLGSPVPFVELDFDLQCPAPATSILGSVQIEMRVDPPSTTAV